MTLGKLEPFRLYGSDECGRDGYPHAWRGAYISHGRRGPAIKDVVREQAGHRCVRCGHPYVVGEHPMERVEREEDGEIVVSFESWSPCDKECSHGGPARDLEHPFSSLGAGTTTGALIRDAYSHGLIRHIEALARILTVHHVNGAKYDCRWWNLAALCQRCHLTIQGHVLLSRVYPWEHSEWFKPYAAGWYASAYLGEELSREQTLARLDELLALERVA